MSDQSTYDVFLSHNSADKPAVEELARRLEDEARLRPFLDRWHLIPGDPWMEALEEALEQSRTCAVFIGPRGISPWENEEMRAAIERRVADREFRVIPVLLPGAERRERGRLPAFLTRATWVEFRESLDDDEAFRHLVAGIKGEPPTYDVFLSHNSADKPAVEELARRLEDEARLRPFLDRWQLIPGDPWQEALEEALKQSRTCAVFIGPRGISAWENEEIRMAIERRVADREFRVIPVLLPGAERGERGRLPAFLTRATWVEFRESLDDDEAFRHLVAGIKRKAPGRGPAAPGPGPEAPSPSLKVTAAVGVRPPYIFISYSHKDKDYAHSLAESLEQEGFSAWIDDRIDYGTHWPIEIEKQLDDCSAFIVIMTPRSYQSKWVQNELNRAARKEKPIFPLFLQGGDPWLSVEATQYVDVRDGSLPPPDFYEDLAQVIPRQKIEGPASSTTQLKPLRPSFFSRYGRLVLGLAVSVGVGFFAGALISEVFYPSVGDVATIISVVAWVAVGTGCFYLITVITRKIWPGK